MSSDMSPTNEPAESVSNTAHANITNWNMWCHLSALSGMIGVPFGHLLGPLIIWLIKKDQLPSVDMHGKEVLNFQISMTIYGFIALLLCFVLVGFVLIPLLYLAEIVFIIVGAVKASNGEFYQYPMTFRFIN